ncbi:MAG: hypothetical protein GXO21_04025 [Aquificae bacterium]|nr:hypothetical protein [Aquificota bacterium]
MKKFPVEEKRTLKQYLLAFFVLFLVFISFVSVLIVVPYLFVQGWNLIFSSLEYNIGFIIVFWLVFIFLAWTIKLLGYYFKY